MPEAAAFDAVVKDRRRMTRLRLWTKKALVVLVIVMLLVGFVLLGLSWIP